MSGKANSETGYFRRMRSKRPKTALKNEPVKLGIPPCQASDAINGASTSSVADQRHHVIGQASVPQIIGLLAAPPAGFERVCTCDSNGLTEPHPGRDRPP